MFNKSGRLYFLKAEGLYSPGVRRPNRYAPIVFVRAPFDCPPPDFLIITTGLKNPMN